MSSTRGVPWDCLATSFTEHAKELVTTQQQDLGDLVEKRVAATGSDRGFDPSSVLTMMMRLALQHDREDVVAFCLHRRTVVDEFHVMTIVGDHSIKSHCVMIEAKAIDINCSASYHGMIQNEAVYTKNLKWAEFCLEKRAHPNSAMVDGYKLVIAVAAEHGFHAMVELLLRFGAKLGGSGAIVLAAGAGHTEILRWCGCCWRKALM